MIVEGNSVNQISMISHMGHILNQGSIVKNRYFFGLWRVKCQQSAFWDILTKVMAKSVFLCDSRRQ